MPGPVSSTATRTFALVGRARTVIDEPSRAVLDGVVDQVGQHLLERAADRRAPAAAGRDHRRRPSSRFSSMRSRNEREDLLGDRRRASTASARGSILLGLDARQVEQVLDQLVQALRVAFDHVDEARRRLGIAQRRAAQRLGRRARPRRSACAARARRWPRSRGAAISSRRIVGDVDEHRQQPRGSPGSGAGVHQQAPRLQAADLDLARARARRPSARLQQSCSSALRITSSGDRPTDVAPQQQASRAAPGSPAGSRRSRPAPARPPAWTRRMRPSRSRSARRSLSVGDRLSASASSARPSSATSSVPARRVRTPRSPADMRRAASVIRRSARDSSCAAPLDITIATTSADAPAPTSRMLPQALERRRRPRSSGTASRATAPRPPPAAPAASPRTSAGSRTVALQRIDDAGTARQRLRRPRADRGGSRPGASAARRPRSHPARRRRRRMKVTRPCAALPEVDRPARPSVAVLGRRGRPRRAASRISASRTNRSRADPIDQVRLDGRTQIRSRRPAPRRAMRPSETSEQLGADVRASRRRRRLPASERLPTKR